MIPKIIHYCWFGGKPLPKLAQKCIASWRKFFPNYEIWQWSEKELEASSNLNDNISSPYDKLMGFDVNSIQYTLEAYDAKKYAFVSDYARFWILYNYGGIYFDTDVEVIKDMAPILIVGNYMGKEFGNGMVLSDGQVVDYVNPGLGLAAEPSDALIKKAIDSYESRHFVNQDGSLDTKTIVTTTTELLLKEGYCQKDGVQTIGGWTIYPKEYFCPKDYVSGVLRITENTYSIHHYDASWKSRRAKIRNRLTYMFGERFISFIAGFRFHKK